MSMFEVGDVVRCIFVEPGPQLDPWEPKVGGVYRIIDTFIGDDGVARIELNEDTHPFAEEGAWNATWFRKIKPASAAFTARIKACRPAHRKVSA